MSGPVHRGGQFAGVALSDAFAQAALDQNPIVVTLPAFAWPQGLAPTAAPLGAYKPGEAITGPAQIPTDVLVILYTDAETQALLEVMTGDNAWTPARKATWCGYGHNFAALKASIENISGDPALEAGLFGYLSALTIGATRVTLFKSELHPKTNGPALPFVTVIEQLAAELKPKLVITTGTAGAIGTAMKCGDVAITCRARLHLQNAYPDFPALGQLSQSAAELTDTVAVQTTWLTYALANYFPLSKAGLDECYAAFAGRAAYDFLQPPAGPSLYVTDISPAPGPQPMDIVSADYLTVDDATDAEGLQALGLLNDTDDAFAVFALSRLPAGAAPLWLSVRNASEPQIDAGLAPGAPKTQVMSTIKSLAGAIYGVFQYCTTLNSAFAVWAVIAGMGG